jgi:plastocyanin
MHPTTQAERTRGARFRLRRVRLLPALVGLALAPLASAVTPAWAARVVGTVTGYVNLENPVWAEAKDPKAKAYTFREMVPTVPAQYRRLYPHLPKEVCVGLLSSAAASAGAPITIKVGGGRTSPVTLVAAPGTKVVFQNQDAFPHRLYGVNNKDLTASEMARGARREWTVPAAGTYEIRDELAPSLRMWIVSETGLVQQTFPSLKGEYSFSVDAPGEYQIQAYFAGQKVGPAVPLSLAARDIALAPIALASSAPASSAPVAPKNEGEKAE